MVSLRMIWAVETQIIKTDTNVKIVTYGCDKLRRVATNHRNYRTSCILAILVRPVATDISHIATIRTTSMRWTQMIIRIPSVDGNWAHNVSVTSRRQWQVILRWTAAYDWYSCDYLHSAEDILVSLPSIARTLCVLKENSSPNLS